MVSGFRGLGCRSCRVSWFECLGFLGEGNGKVLVCDYRVSGVLLV